MKNSFYKFSILLLGILSIGTITFAASILQTFQGGTGTSTPSGILYGDNGATTHVNTVTIGSNLTFSGGTLSATGGGGTFPFTPTSYGVSTSTTIGFLNGLFSTASSTINASTTITGPLTLVATTTSSKGFNISGGCFAINDSCVSSGGSGTVTNIATTFPILGGPITTTGTLTFGGISTSSNPIIGQLPYWTGVNTLGSVATTSVTCSGSTSCTSFVAIGSSPITISSTGDGVGYDFPNVQSWGNATSTTLGFLNGYLATASSTNTATSTLFGILSGVTAQASGVDRYQLAIDGFTGKIGIGTIAPVALFEADRTASFASNQTFIGFGTSQNLTSNGGTNYGVKSDIIKTSTNASGNTTYGLYSSITPFTTQTHGYGVYSTITTDNGTAGYFNASGASAYGIYSNAGVNYFNGNVGIGTTSPYSPLSVVGTTTAAQFEATSTIATSKFSGNFQVIGNTTLGILLGALDAGGATSFEIPNGSGPTVDATGEIAVDTTSDQLIYFGATAKKVLTPQIYPAFSYSTSTAWAGTTTIPLGPAYIAETWAGVQCFTDAGTVGVSFYDGSNRMSYIPTASTTVNINALTTNNSFTAGEKRYVDIGTPISSPTKISCTVSKSYDAD